MNTKTTDWYKKLTESEKLKLEKAEKELRSRLDHKAEKSLKAFASFVVNKGLNDEQALDFIRTVIDPLVNRYKISILEIDEDLLNICYKVAYGEYALINN